APSGGLALALHLGQLEQVRGLLGERGDARHHDRVIGRLEVRVAVRAPLEVRTRQRLVAPTADERLRFRLAEGEDLGVERRREGLIDGQGVMGRLDRGLARLGCGLVARDGGLLLAYCAGSIGLPGGTESRPSY